jgi:hypothetical protein
MAASIALHPANDTLGNIKNPYQSNYSLMPANECARNSSLLPSFQLAAKHPTLSLCNIPSVVSFVHQFRPFTKCQAAYVTLSASHHTLGQGGQANDFIVSCAPATENGAFAPMLNSTQQP